jgi:hypothetical protein
MGASCRFAAGPGYPLQFLSFTAGKFTCGKASGISASIPCAFPAEAFFRRPKSNELPKNPLTSPRLLHGEASG